MTKTARKIVKIDEERCDGCGICIISCAEGALKIIDGKARLVSDIYCDGLGACLGKCPQDAITVEEREAEEFDEAAVERHLTSQRVRPSSEAGPGTLSTPAKTLSANRLNQWPVQLALVSPDASYLKNADLVLAADCAAFAYPGFLQDFLGDNRALIIACPKLDNFSAHQQKLNEILRQSDVKSLKVVHMEVPCCSGLVHLASQAIRDSGKEIPLQETTITIQGNLKLG